MTGDAETLLEIQGLKIEGQSEEGWQEIVHGVDVTLAKGEVLGLIGESGAGKSTIGLASMGFARDGCRISGGSIVFDGRDLARLGEGERRNIRGARIAYVAQSAAAAFNPSHTLMNQIVEGPVRHGIIGRAEAEANATRLFETLGLPEPDRFGSRFPHQVSGGQLQRAMTVMALACKPELIVFDEPTTALDVTTQVEVLAAIKRAIQEEGTASLYITHDLAVVAQVADRIMVLRYGNIVELGETGQILHEPREDYTRALVNVHRVGGDETPPATGNPVLEVIGVDASYTRSQANLVLENITVAVQPGTTLAVVGESGSGKSTLARVVTGLLPPLAGEVRFKGKAPAPSAQGPAEGRAARAANDLPDARCRLEPAAEGGRHHRSTARILLRHHRQGAQGSPR